MDGTIIACIQHRMSIPATREEFESLARRFLRQARAKAAQITVFPEQSGLMLAPPLISGLKLGLVKRADRARQPRAGLLSRSLGGLSQAAAGALGGGFRGSVARLVSKNSDFLLDLYFDVMGNLAREFSTAIVGGSLYLYDAESDSLRHRVYLFDADGQVLGYQDKLNLTPDERDLATPGTELKVLQSRQGRLGLLIGRDALYPELARLLALQGADLIIGVAAVPGAPQARLMRAAMALRAEENQVYTASTFLLGPNYLGKEESEEFFGQSAIMAPLPLSERSDGVLVQAGTNRTEAVIVAQLDMDALYRLRETAHFRPRQEMSLGDMGPVLAEMYQQGLTIDAAIATQLAGPTSPPPTFVPLAAEPEPGSQPEMEALAEEGEGAEAEGGASIPEALSLSTPAGEETAADE